MSDGPVNQALGLCASPLDAQETDVGGFCQLSVATGRLAQLFTRSRGVEHVVGYLKSESNVLSICRQRLEPASGCLSSHPAQGAGSSDQRSRFSSVDLDQVSEWEPAAFGLQVEPLPADHAFDPAGIEQLLGHLSEDLYRETQLRGGRGQNAGRHWYQEISREGSGRDVEGSMGGGPASPEIVVVHAGEIVMHQRIGVNGLYRRRHTADSGRSTTHSPIRRQEQCSPNPLAGRSKRIGKRLPSPSTHLLFEALRPAIQQTIRLLSCFPQQIRNRC
jgi:hypothetical protein